MRRSGVIGALVLIVAMVGGPAFAQSTLPEGSTLPEQQQTQTLPSSGGQASSSGSASSGSASSGSGAAQASSPGLADTGMQVSTGAALGFGLLAAGAGALVLARRRRVA